MKLQAWDLVVVYWSGKFNDKVDDFSQQESGCAEGGLDRGTAGHGARLQWTSMGADEGFRKDGA